MNSEQKRVIAEVAHKIWSCGVVRSGKGTSDFTCRPGEPHGSWWGCGYRYELSVSAEVIEP